jgi:hypothetical protein
MTNSIEIGQYIHKEYSDYELLCHTAISINQEGWVMSMPKTLKTGDSLNIPLVKSLSVAEILEHGKNEYERTRIEYPWLFPFLQEKTRKTHEIIYSCEEVKPEYIEEKMFEVSFLISVYGVLLEHNL